MEHACKVPRVGRIASFSICLFLNLPCPSFRFRSQLLASSPMFFIFIRCKKQYNLCCLYNIYVYKLRRCCLYNTHIYIYYMCVCACVTYTNSAYRITLHIALYLLYISTWSDLFDKIRRVLWPPSIRINYYPFEASFHCYSCICICIYIYVIKKVYQRLNIYYIYIYIIYCNIIQMQ